MVKGFEQAQKFGRSFMLPIAILPAAGLLLGIGGSLSNPETVKIYPFLDIFFLQSVFKVMSASGSIIFANLAPIFAIGIAVGLAKSDRGTAGIAAFIGYLVMNATIGVLIEVSGKAESFSSGAVGFILGIKTLETGVFGGVIVGILTYYLHARFNKIDLPKVLGFFSGSRFVPIVVSFSSIFLAVIMFIFWPFVQNGINKAGGLVNSTGYIGTLIYGIFLRMLGPFGLHHIFYLPFWTTGLGGSVIIDGKLIEGTQNIFFAELAAQGTNRFFVGTSRFMSGRFITMMFGLPGAALALYYTAKRDERAKVFGLLISAALTSFMTGITEPLEFSFLFVAPMLYIVHAIFDGFAFMLAHILQITIGQTFSGGFIDFILFGILQGNSRTNWLLVPVVGTVWFFLYYFAFVFLINKFDFKTPGRTNDLNSVDSPNSKSNEFEENYATKVIIGLGGASNIVELDCCATRLRITVKDVLKVSEKILKKTGSKGVIIKGNGVQVVYGPGVSVLKNEIEELLDD
ncbi:maltose/glucose-specific PTS transporter subunit IIC [Borreliella yangtzensis]|uniref:PTS system glucose-specific IIC component/PTS system maltose and glucose-specific IIC component n=1 Tax=Borreliella yangtzensis TaxID=683292 RepID=A0ABR6P8N6_9SPIR|nr:maltose/glucose-specific PTS transporter subunit IIC [Borreliella yangtzensis]MBB6042630.1 PTS system glucose-specific IIC component/PTS system maltose and glucose-specific IIC component [Borreliella yangtzensis]WKC73594.1 maltose/glucose-specific PTS transporter subunit IIC [Borreliella yangtzensis]WKC74510.1 maltose/glucose-specific PTS transporter subunit IIC [Borreliella yangtzensis]